MMMMSEENNNEEIAPLAAALDGRLGALSRDFLPPEGHLEETPAGAAPVEVAPPPVEVPEAEEDVAPAEDAAPGWPEVRLPIHLPAVELARVIAETVRDRDCMFVRDDMVIARIHGRFVPMIPALLTTWLYGQGIVPTEDGEPTDMPERVSNRVLLSNDLRRRLKPLNGVNQIKLPVLREELEETGQAARRGFRRMELLPLGYDERSGIWTEHTVDYVEDWDYDTAREWIDRHFRHFQWEDDNRFAVHMAAVFSAFCRDMYFGKAPMFIWNSNIPNSGKSTLARMILRFIFGKASPLVLDQRNKRELRQELNSLAMAHADAVWFDDVQGKLFAEELRPWALEDWWSGRILGVSQMFEVRLRTLTFFTGAKLGIDDHLGRRSLWIDLFPRRRKTQLPSGAVKIDAQWLANLQNRKEFLAAVWACVRHWDGQGRPMGSDVIDSLEGWSEVVPGIVASMGFGDCLAKRSNDETGDLDSAEAKKLIEAVIRKYRLDGSCTSIDVIATARIERLFVHILKDLDLLVADLDTRRGWRWQTVSADGQPTDGEKRRQAARFRDEKMDAKWGVVWKRLALEGIFHEVDGKTYLFEKEKTRAGTVYKITEVEVEPEPPGAALNA